MAADRFSASDGSGVALPMIHPEQAKLIVLEGIDLSGRTTQVQLLHDWLVAQRYAVTMTAWLTSPLISDVLARARLGPPLRPLSYSLLYCADHMDRTQRVIKPALERGEIVLADRYIYTAFARDSARGLDAVWVRNLYRFSLRPDMIFYLHISPEEAVKRRLTLQQQQGRMKKASKDGKEGKQLKPSEKKQFQAGTPAQMPILTGEALESFRNFEIKMYSEYQSMQKEFGFSVVEGSHSIASVQAILQRTITRLLLNRSS